MAQQTAVEWLIEQIEGTDSKIARVIGLKKYNEIVQQAKAMEKEQRIRDYNAGYTDAQCNHINDAENYSNEQDYINNK